MGINMTDAELAILSLLNDGIHTDIALHAEIEARGLRRWTAIGVSSMYYVLEKLVKQGLVETIPEKAPERAWKITSAGFGVLQTAVADLIGTPHNIARGFELGLVNLRVLKPSQVRGALQNYIHEIGSRMQRAQHEMEKETAKGGKFEIIALYSHTISLLEAELKWVKGFAADYDKLGLQDPQPPPLEVKPIPRIQQVVLPEDPDSIHKETTIQRVPPQAPKTP
jgi:DNA-binding PadR family transcriptional regulator